MGGDIKSVVIGRAREEANQILTKAEEEAKRIIEEAKKSREAIIAREREKLTQSIGVERRIAEARMRARQIISEAKMDIVKEIEEEVKQLLDQMSNGLRMRSLENLIIEAVDEILNNVGSNPGKVVIYIARRDLDLYEKISRSIKNRYRGIDIEVREASILGGAIVENVDHHIIIDNSYDARLKKAMSISLKELQRLFE